MRRLLRRLLITVGVLVFTVIVLAVATPQGRAAVRAALFIPQVLNTIPVKPQEWVGRDPVWREVRFPMADGEGVADVIVPAGSGKHSAVLFFIGVVVNQPRDDPRLVNLAEGLARSGMVVMMPWLETQVVRHIVTEDIDNLVWAFQYLRGLDEVDPERVGMGGYCTGASMATVAAEDERIRDDVKFVNFFAGYYDAVDFTKAIGSRSRFYGDYVASWQPDKLTLEVFTWHLIDGVTDPRDKDLLDRIFLKKEKEAEAEVDSLTPQGEAVYKIVKGAPYDEVEELMQRLSPQTYEFFEQVSPSTNIDQLKARVLIMHDRGDLLVPSEESRRMAEALADNEDTYFTEFSFFQKELQLHVDPEAGVGPIGFAREAFKLFMHMYNIMRDVG